MRHGAILLRPCICRGSIMNPRDFRPAHRFWPIRKRAFPPGVYTSPRYIETNISRIAKCVFDKANIPDSARYASKCFRRGRSDATNDPRPTLFQIARAAGRAAAGYRSYRLFPQRRWGISNVTRSLDLSDPEVEIDPIIDVWQTTVGFRLSSFTRRGSLI